MAMPVPIVVPDLHSLVAEYERRLIVEALAETNGCQARAAARLGVRPTTLHEKIKRLGIRAEFLPAPGEPHPRLLALHEAELQWRGALSAGTVLELRGVSGAVWARRTPGPEATVVAAKGRASGAHVALSVLESAQRVSFSVVRAPSEGTPEGEGLLGRGMRELRVEFRVGVPPGVDLVVRLLAGDIEVMGLDGRVEARTDNGRVSIFR